MSGWSVVQRLLQLARELVKSRYESGLRRQGSVITSELGKNKLSYYSDIEAYL